MPKWQNMGEMAPELLKLWIITLSTPELGLLGDSGSWYSLMRSRLLPLATRIGKLLSFPLAQSNAFTSGLMSGLTSGGTIASILDTFFVFFLVGVKFAYLLLCYYNHVPIVFWDSARRRPSFVNSFSWTVWPWVGTYGV